MRTSGLAAIAGIVCLLLFPVSAGAAAGAVEVVPSTAVLAGDARAGLRVVVTNTSKQPLERVVVRTLRAGAAGIDVRVQTRRPIRILPGASRSWKLLVKDTGGAVAQKIEVIARYRTVSEAGMKTSAVVHASADLKPAAVPDPAAVASLQLHATLTTLRSGKSEKVYLVLANKSGATLQATGIESRIPDFLRVSGGDDPFDVGPGETKLIPLKISAEDQVRPGKHQLVFAVPVRVGARERPITLTAAQAVDVAVTGESEVLTALGVPALFVMPGFLVLATMALLWRTRILRKKWDSDAFFVETKSVEFWVAAITLSIPLVLAWSQAGTDLLDRYGLEDVVAVWLTSVLLGAAAYTAYVLIRNKRREGQTPESGDDPIRTLEKIHKQGLNVMRERRDYLDASGTKILYAIQSLDDTRPATWMSPAIDYSGPDNDPALATLITRHLNETRDAGSLAAALRTGRDAGEVTVRWSTDAHPVNGPRLIDKEKIGGEQGTDAIVHET